jgi:hypothetical protein
MSDVAKITMPERIAELESERDALIEALRALNGIFNEFLSSGEITRRKRLAAIVLAKYPERP